MTDDEILSIQEMCRHFRRVARYGCCGNHTEKLNWCVKFRKSPTGTDCASCDFCPKSTQKLLEESDK